MKLHKPLDAQVKMLVRSEKLVLYCNATQVVLHNDKCKIKLDQHKRIDCVFVVALRYRFWMAVNKLFCTAWVAPLFLHKLVYNVTILFVQKRPENSQNFHEFLFYVFLFKFINQKNYRLDRCLKYLFLFQNILNMNILRRE